MALNTTTPPVTPAATQGNQSAQQAGTSALHVLPGTANTTMGAAFQQAQAPQQQNPMAQAAFASQNPQPNNAIGFGVGWSFLDGNIPGSIGAHVGNEQINGENIGVPKGEVGTHFMASIGEYAVPFIQERNNKLQFVSNPKYNDPESMRFESPEDAEYFAEHYKDVAPMMQSFEDGGKIPETIKNPYSFPGKSKDKRPELSVTNTITNTPAFADNIVKKRTHVLGNPIQDPIKYDNKMNDLILKGVNEALDFPQKATVYALSKAVETVTNPMHLPVNPFGVKVSYSTPSEYVNSYYNESNKPLNPLSSYLIDGVADPLNFIPYGQYTKPLKVINKTDNLIDAYDYMNQEVKNRASELKTKLKE